MKIFYSLLLILATTCLSKADMLLITATNSPNQITVASNQVLVISAVRTAYSTNNNYFSPYIPIAVFGGSFSSNSIQYPFLLPYGNIQPLAWAGPIAITFAVTDNHNGTSGPYLISYQLIQSTNIQTIIIPQTNSSPGQFSFQIPSGRKAHFFAPFSEIFFKVQHPGLEA